MTETPLNRLAVYAIIAGVVTGVMVAAINWAVIFTERFVFGTDHIATLGPGETVAPGRLAITIVFVGVATAIAWFALDRFGRPTVSVPGAMKGEKMPVIETVISAFVQVCSVAAGAPVGRENAPRLIGGLAAAGMSNTFRLDGDARRILVASAAGAGLAASFHLPLAGALFTLELLLVEMSTRTVVASMLCSATAVATTGLFVHHHPIYRAVVLTERPEVLLAAILVGAIAGSFGHFFGRAARRVAASRARGVQVLWQMPLAFILVAVLAYFIPGVSGNGRFVAQTLLFEGMTLKAMLLVGLCRAALTLLCFRVGTVGGTLTPAFALGAMVGAAIGTLVHPLFPSLPIGAFALLGAAAFLSTTMAAPMFGMLAAVEFTDMQAQGYLAMFITVIAAALATRAWAVLIDKEQRHKPLMPAHWTHDRI
ncbi:chloride channel protein [Corynebacterium aquilae]|uniref:Chloride channel protein n=1 Tax=Corynebacterium aquilae DSM 44791 TaxID=1431546 RepID=A0A1L7CEA6_9CORY|nr:chloride channel protein [Corynebacterium aquilae]APT84202.1 chloride channel protein [Corynebacterium aquilae DSM 44791]